jgi:hypothetical protein
MTLVEVSSSGESGQAEGRKAYQQRNDSDLHGRTSMQRIITGNRGDGLNG